MKIKYITNVRIPTTRAQGYAIMKMCEEFSLAGIDIELIVPNRRSNEETSDPFKYYGIKNKFPIKKLWSFDLLGPFEVFGKLFYWIDMLSFLTSVKINTRKFDGVFYTRDYLVALVLPKYSFICLELHDMPSSKLFFNFILRKVSKYVVLNKILKNELMSYGISEERILISPSGVDIAKFDLNISKDEAREKVFLPKGNLVVYSGHLYSWKGVDILAEVAKSMVDTNFLFIGGVEPELSNFKKKYEEYKNIIVLPFIERILIPLYLKGSDILVLPNTAKENISKNYTSPLKMVEYMASGRPIIASKLPSILEVLDDSNSVLVESDSVVSLEKALRNILSNPQLADRLSKKARGDVSNYN